MPKTTDKPKPITFAKIDGQIIEYDMATVNETTQFSKTFEYIGKGKIYSVNGVRQPGNNILHFWQYKPEYMKLRWGENNEYR